MIGGTRLSAIVSWLRTGYPEGVPQRDYLPLFALLSRRLTDDEVLSVATELSGRTDPASREAVEELIEALTSQTALPADVERVEAHLSGFPSDP
jgi:hypothetical protein